ncbi:hypothetical protein VTN00DRAFT_8182 [Thermoascus crustaceus]|uniref:uncharacterized protein n=1 Tax=Thermoascus crustaceus TaxID=5088 RepID=UPI0037423722
MSSSDSSTGSGGGATSTIKSYIDQAAGAAQNLVNSVTESVIGSGSNNSSSSDKDSTNNPKYDQTVGSLKEATGNLTGNPSLRRAGEEQNAAGKAHEAEAQLKDWGQGVSDRVQGHLGAVGAAVAGDREEEDRWRAVHDEGKRRQEGVERDVERSQGAEEERKGGGK